MSTIKLIKILKILDEHLMALSAVIGVLILLVGGCIVFLFVMNNQIPTVGIYIMFIGIFIVIIGDRDGR